MSPRSILPIILLVACTSRNVTPYGSCNSSTACAEVSPRCVQTNNRITMRQIGLCTVTCVTSADCPDHGVCVNTETAALGMICAQRCTNPTDPAECRFSGAICAEIRSGENACVP